MGGGAPAGTSRGASAAFTAPRGESLEDRIRERAFELGFDCFGIAAALPPPREDHERLTRFVAEGRHASMTFLETGLAARARVDCDAIVPGARSVVCVARSTRRDAVELSRDGGLLPLIARYARGRDYHSVLRRKLGALVRFVQSCEPGARARALCDTAPILERAWAARAGVGFIGKSGMLVSPTHGTELVLGEVVTTLALEPTPPSRVGCGDCIRCLEACPTGALGGAWWFDARRCVSYLTIEHRGSVEPGLRHAAAASLFGCDGCQDACPFNGSGCAAARDPSPFRPLPVWSELRLVDLVRQDAADWRERARGSALRRLDVSRVARNALQVAARQLLEPAADRIIDTDDARAALDEGLRAAEPELRELSRALTSR